jgi:hypothetical protein
VLLLVAASGRAAHAGGKPTVAILGVEVIDPGNLGIDAQSTDTAKGLTEGLRSRAKAGTGPLALAPGSEKELIDEKFLTGCDSEQNACMAKIGADLNAEQLMFGNIQKKATGYLLSMKLLNVGGKNIVRSVNETIPFTEATGAQLQSWSKRIYAKLTGDTSGGILVIKANVERGTVLIEGEPKGSLVGGRATVSGLAEGKYKLAIEAEGYQRYETSVTINAGETTSSTANLDPTGLKGGSTKPIDTGVTGTVGLGSGNPPLHETSGTVSESGGGGAWKGVFVASAVLAAGSGGLWIYGYKKIGDANSDISNNCPMGKNKCPNTFDPTTDNGHGKTGHNDTIYGGIGVGAFGALAIVSLYEGFIKSHDDMGNEHAMVGHRKHKDLFAVTPVLLPNGGGATLQLEW